MLNNIVQNTFCTPEWIAKTYGEYMFHAAEKYASIMDIAQQAIECGSEEYFAESQAELDAFNDMVKSKIDTLSEEMEVDLNTVSVDSPEFEAFVEAFNADADLASEFSTHFNSPELVHSNYLRMNMPQYKLHIENDEIENDFNTVSALVTTDIPDTIQYLKSYDNKCELLSDYLLQNADMINTSIALNGGYTDFKSLTKSIISNANSKATEKAKLLINATDINGDLVCPENELGLGYSLQSLSSEFSANLSSAVQFGAGFLASSIENIPDRIKTFESLVESKLGTLKTKVDTTTQVIKGTLTTAKDGVSAFLNFFKKSNDMDKTEEHSPLTMDASWMYKYTGACPTVVLYADNAWNVITSAVKAVWNGICTVLENLGNLLSKGLYLAGKWLSNTFVDPHDIGEIEGNPKNGLVSGFQFQNSGQDYLTVWHGDEELTSELCEYLNEKISDSWISYKSCFGEHFFKCHSVREDTEYVDHAHIEYDFDTIYKPRTLNPSVVFLAATMADDELGTNVCSTWTTTTTHNVDVTHYMIDVSAASVISDPAEITLWMNTFGKNLMGMDMYNDVNTSEDVIEMGFELASQLEDYVCSLEQFLLAQQISGLASIVDIPFVYQQGIGSNVPLVSLQWVNENYAYYGDTDPTWNITNLDFIKAVSGYFIDSNNNNTQHLNRFPHKTIQVTYSGDGYSADYYSPTLTRILLNSMIDKKYDPDAYMYVPYSNDYQMPSDCQYYIKTDDDNSSVASFIINALIVVAIVAVFSVTTISMFKAWKRRSYFKRATYNGSIDSAMWEGNVPSAKEMKKYIRNQKKINKTTLFGDSVENTANMLDSINSIKDNGMNLYYQSIGASTASGESLINTKETYVENPFDSTNESIYEVKNLIV